jgi:hypothetical protein
VVVDVVTAAEQHQVVEIGGTAVAPVDDVVHVAQLRGRATPGCWRWRSRIVTALRNAALTTRVERPRSSTRDSPAITMRATFASQARRSIVARPIGP